MPIFFILNRMRIFSAYLITVKGKTLCNIIMCEQSIFINIFFVRLELLIR